MGSTTYRTMLMKQSTSWSMHLDKKGCSVGFVGNIVDLWERLVERDVYVHLGSDQTSLHNPYQGGYFPAGLRFDDAQRLMHEEPSKFKEKVKDSLRRHVDAVNSMTDRGMFFWDYGNAFLLESGRVGADVFKEDGSYKYPSYVEDIMGPLCFDRGFGPFRWVCSSGLDSDLLETDRIAGKSFKTCSSMNKTKMFVNKFKIIYVGYTKQTVTNLSLVQRLVSSMQMSKARAYCFSDEQGHRRWSYQCSNHSRT